MKTTLRRSLQYGLFAVVAFMCASTFAGYPVTDFLSPDTLAALGAAGAMPFVMSGEVTLLEVKTLIEGQGTAFDEYKKTNDARIEAIKKGLPTGDFDAKLAKIDEQLNGLAEAKEAIEKIQLKMNREQQHDTEGKSPADRLMELKQFNLNRKATARAGHSIADITEDGYAAYKSAVNKMFREGREMLSSDEVKSLQAGVDTDGGFLLPANTVGRTVKKIYETSHMRAIASSQSISTNALEGIVDNDEAEAGWVGETQARTGNDGTPEVGKWKIEAFEMYSQPKATQTILDDAAVDIEAWLSDKVSTKMARKENNAFCVGNGVTQPMGFTAYATSTTGDDTRAWGTMQHIITGTNGDFGATAATAQDKLIDLIGEMRPEYLSNARWATRREVITKIRKFKDANNLYLWQPSLVLGQPDSLLAYPVSILPDMPALSANGLSLAFGDFREGYMIVDRIGIRVIRDHLTSKPYIKFYTTKRVGGGVLNFEAIKFLKFSA